MHFGSHRGPSQLDARDFVNLSTRSRARSLVTAAVGKDIRGATEARTRLMVSDAYCHSG